MTRGHRQSKRVYGGLALIFAAAGAAAVIALLGIDLRSHPSNRVSGMPSERFEARVRDYLYDNPEVIAESLQRLELRNRFAAQDRLKAVLSDKADDIFRDPDSPVGGNPNGDVTIVEFADYNCPYCRRVAPLIAEMETDDPGVRVVYKEIPILGEDSVFAAKAALAAHEQGKYVAFHRALMNAKGVAAEGLVLAIAGKVGLDVEKLRADIEAPSIQAAIDRNLALARKLGINGTPTFIVGDQVVQGAIDLTTMKRLVTHTRAENRRTLQLPANR
jgi:protein-disulfide isomerase